MGTVSQACLNMKAFVIVALVAAVSGEADPYTIGQVLAGQTNGGVLTSTTYHGGVKVAGFPYTKVAAVPHTYTYGYPYAYYGKREAEAELSPGLLVRLLQELTSRRQSRMGEPTTLA